jgi:hypothetical protein
MEFEAAKLEVTIPEASNSDDRSAKKGPAARLTEIGRETAPLMNDGRPLKGTNG